MIKNRANLTRKPIVDKNGKHTFVWVKTDVKNKVAPEITVEVLDKKTLKEVGVSVNTLKSMILNFIGQVGTDEPLKAGITVGKNDVYFYCESKNNPSIMYDRTFLKKGGKLIVKHETLSIPYELQKKGFAKKLMKHDFDLYKKIGVSKVELLANDTVGGYAWAKYGFEALKQSVEDVLLNESDSNSFVSKLPENIAADMEYLYNMYTEAYPKAKYFPMHLWVNYGGEEQQEIIKEALLDTHWMGSIDLNNSESMERLYSYIG